MHASFVIVCAACAWLFWRRKRIDPMLLGFIACLYYFAPGLIGRVPAIPYSLEVVPGAHGVMLVVVLITTAAAWCVDRVPAGVPVSLPVRGVPQALLAIALGAAAVSTFTIGRGYFCEKPIMMASIDRWYYVAAYAASLCFATAAAERARPAVLVAAAALLLADNLVGFRAGTAIAIMATVLVYGARVVPRIKPLMWFGAAALVGALVFVAGREAAIQTKYQLAGFCVARAPTPVPLADSPEALPRTRAGQPIVEQMPQVPFETNLIARMFGEPVTIQTTLSEVVRRNFTTDGMYLLDQLKTALPGAGLVFGVNIDDVKSFNLLYQPKLFPQDVGGRANNPWAQAFAAGGLAMVALFAAGYAGGLALLTLLFRRTQGALQAIVAVLASWWGFYSHRNDLLIEIGIMKMVVYVAIAALLIGWLAERYLRRASDAEHHPLTPPPPRAARSAADAARPSWSPRNRR
jgi:hypothetical protein